MKMFPIDSKKTILKGAAVLCAASLLSACAQAQDSTQEAPLTPSSASVETTSESIPDTTEQTLLETGATITTPVETVDMSSVMEEALITVTSYEGIIGDYNFFDCNETQIFGDYSIARADYNGNDYLMLSYNGVALLAKEDGSDAKLFYDGQRLDLPFSCNFNVEYEFLKLQEGDFLGNSGRQLALIIPIETGSGIDVEELQLIDLDQMSVVPSYTMDKDYEDTIHSLFETHFAEIGMKEDFSLFHYVQYSIYDGLIFVEYGACDEDNNYLSFLEGSLTVKDGKLVLNPAVTFMDETCSSYPDA